MQYTSKIVYRTEQWVLLPTKPTLAENRISVTFEFLEVQWSLDYLAVSQLNLTPILQGGIFLGFTATSRNIYYRDSKTKRVKIATHVTFDEAGYTIPDSQLTPIQRTLQCCGHEQDQHCTTSIPEEIPSNTNVLQVQLLTPQATLPTRGTPDSAGLDLYSATQVDLPPGVPTAVPTNIAVCPPPGTYCQ